MQMMPGGDDHRVDCGVVENFPLIRGARMKSEFLAGVPRMRTIRRAGDNHLNSANSLECGEHRTDSEGACPEQADLNGLVAVDGGIGGRDVDVPSIVGILRIREQHAEERLRRLPCNQIVGRLRTCDRKTMRH